MKKFLLFLTLLVSAIGLSHAEVKSYTITFNGVEGTSDGGTELKSDKQLRTETNITEGYSLISSMTGSKVWAARNYLGFKIGSGSATGSITINLAESASAQVIPTKIVVRAAKYGTDAGSVKISVNGKANTTTYKPQTTEAEVLEDLTWDLSGSEKMTSLTVATTEKRAFIKSITVYYDDAGIGGGEVSKDCGIAWKQGETILEEGATVKAFLGSDNTLPTLSNPKTVNITYSSSDDNVASIAADGTIKIKAVGTTTINASFAGNDKYDPKEVTFTLTVKETQIAYLVTDYSTLKPGDTIIIVNQANGKAMSNAENANNRKAADVTFSLDNSTVTFTDNVLLLELQQTDGFWSFLTTNYLGTNGNGFLTTSESTSSEKNYLKITTTESDYTLATISITDGDATIKLNKGTDPSTENTQNRNLIRYNETSTLFSCYGSGQQPVQIYKISTVNTEVSEINFVEKVNASDNNVVKITANFLTSSSYNKVAIYMEDVLVGIYDVINEEVKGTFDHVPYLPSAKFTMRPVLKTDTYGNPTQLGPSEALSFTWPDINTYGAVELDNALVWIGSDADPLPTTATLGAISYFGIDVKVANLNYYVDVEAKNQSTGDVYNGEFAWCEGGFSYAVNPYITGVPVDTEDKRLKLGDYTGEFPIIEFSITPIYKFDVAEKYRSLVPAPTTPRPARVASSTITDGVQTVVCDAKPAKSEFSAASDVSGVESVTVDANAPVEFFNLQGVRVDGDLAPGIYIRRQGQAVSKVRIN